MSFPKPRPALSPNTYEYESSPLVKPTGFREYDARWLFGQEINLMGVQALGLGLGTLIHEIGVKPEVVTGHDFRSYSASIKLALVTGLMAAGCKVHDIGLAVTPMAYFAQFDLDVPCVAMVTASHNDNGWTGVKMGANRPLTFGPDEMGRGHHQRRYRRPRGRPHDHRPDPRQEVSNLAHYHPRDPNRPHSCEQNPAEMNPDDHASQKEVVSAGHQREKRPDHGAAHEQEQAQGEEPEEGTGALIDGEAADVARPVLAVLQVLLVDQDAQQRANRRVAGRNRSHRRTG